MQNLTQRVSEAIKHFWVTREAQITRQTATGKTDAGSRGAVTGGAQLDGFIMLVSDILKEAGLPDASIIKKCDVIIPGYFRPTKEWDLLVVSGGQLLAVIEFKSQVGPSFGNNFNNRTEEAMGSAVDLWAAYREGAFKPSNRPWLGYFMLLEKADKSTSPVRVKEPYFSVFPEFNGASYAKRYEIFCEKLMRDRLYDSTCFLVSPRDGGLNGEYEEPSVELGFKQFITSLSAKAIAFLRT